MGKNIYICTDLEGISGIDDMSQVSDTHLESYRFSLERLMLDVNAAVAGLFDGGAEKVYVLDGHGGGKNFIPDMLDKRATQAYLTNDVDLSTIDATIYIGAHAMSGTLNAFLDHTQSSLAWHDYIVNGRRSGELAQEAMFFGNFGVPLLMVSGDEAACVEGKQFFGDIECAVVKYAVGRNKARSIDLDEALLKIRTAACKSLSLIGKIKPYKPIMPLEIIVEFNRADYCDVNVKPTNERIDARTLRKVVHEIKTYYDIMI